MPGCRHAEGPGFLPFYEGALLVRQAGVAGEPAGDLTGAVGALKDLRDVPDLRPVLDLRRLLDVPPG